VTHIACSSLALVGAIALAAADLTGQAARRARPDDSPARLSVRSVADGRAFWSGPDTFALRGVEDDRDDVEPGRARIHFAPVLRLREWAAPLALDVPEGGEVRVRPGYTSTGDLLWSETFAHPLVESWSTAGDGAGWRVADGVLGQDADLSAMSTCVLAGSWSGYEVSVRLRVPAGAVAGLVVAWRDTDNFVAVTVEGSGDPDEGGARRITEVRDGNPVLIAEDRRGVAADRWFELAVRLDGDALRVALDGRAILGGVSPRGQGGVGFVADAAGGARFDDFALRRRGPDDADAQPLFLDDFGGRRLVGFDSGIPEGVPADRSWQQEKGALRHRPFGTEGALASLVTVRGGEWRDYLLTSRVRAESRDATFGVDFRVQGPGDHYRLAWDPERGAFALTRSIGGSEYEIAVTDPVPFDVGRWHDLAVQAHGFQIRVDWDHEPVLRVLDGAHAQGRIGVFAADGADVAFDELRLDPVQELVPSLALVRDGAAGTAEIVGHDPRAPGAAYWTVLLSADLPVVRWLGPDGVDPFLVVESERSWFGAGCEVFNHTRGMRGVLDNRGRFRTSIEWPPLPALHDLPFGATAWVIEAGGSAIRSRFPAVR